MAKDNISLLLIGGFVIAALVVIYLILFKNPFAKLADTGNKAADDALTGTENTLAAAGKGWENTLQGAGDFTGQTATDARTGLENLLAGLGNNLSSTETGLVDAANNLFAVPGNLLHGAGDAIGNIMPKLEFPKLW